jgi:3-methylfumaryl-CoA hydratase
MNVDIDHLRSWLGRTESRTETMGVSSITGLSATLDRDDPQPVAGSPIPPLAHWMFFQPQALQSQIGEDGHPRRGGFLPPVPLPRRMWAGSRVEFLAPLGVDEKATRVSRIAKVDHKAGRTGSLVFVTVEHEISNARGVALREEQDIVYRDMPQPGAAQPAPQPAPTDEAFSREIVPDPVLLFRYSALTFNGHRIHYDRSYVTEVEGYPGLVVHGPMIATMLLDGLRRHKPDARVTRFEFKAVRPIFDIHRFTTCGRPVPEAGPDAYQLWARDHEGMLAMQARARLA